MKDFLFLVLALFASFILQSCSSDEEPVVESPYPTEKQVTQDYSGVVWSMEKSGAKCWYVLGNGERFDISPMLGGWIGIEAIMIDEDGVTEFYYCAPLSGYKIPDAPRHYRATDSDYKYDPLTGILTYHVPTYYRGIYHNTELQILEMNSEKLVLNYEFGVLPYEFSGDLLEPNYNDIDPESRTELTFVSLTENEKASLFEKYPPIEDVIAKYGYIEIGL